MNTLNDYCTRFEELNASTETINEAREAFLKTILNEVNNEEINLPDFISLDTIEDADFDDIYSVITDELDDQNAFDQEVIYYGSAMEYLTNHDPSLRDSLKLAHDFGFSLENLNSEALASLLKSEICREEWVKAESEIQNNVEEARQALDALLEELEAQAEEEEEEEA